MKILRLPLCICIKNKGEIIAIVPGKGFIKYLREAVIILTLIWVLMYHRRSVHSRQKMIFYRNTFNTQIDTYIFMNTYIYLSIISFSVGC